MILLTIRNASGDHLAIKTDDGILVLKELAGRFSAFSDSFPNSLGELLCKDGAIARLKQGLADVLSGEPELQMLFHPEHEFCVTLPFLPRSIICVGLNYRDHAHEAGLALPEEPILFAKMSRCAIGPDRPITIPTTTRAVDYEAELGVVIGRRCRNIHLDESLQFVAGYTCFNDVSARDFQRKDGQWFRAKSLDTFGPMGPYLVTTDEIPDPQRLDISCKVNGDLRQHSNTSKMVFSVKELIAYVSRFVTLEAGDLISTGTPNGVGSQQKPPSFLASGDEVVVEIDRVGCLRNIVEEQNNES
jgi:2-keto-4-pentenoate hydratase/2-oxohepta-3-ene-1,7-dioic acid hydratase in catechol pathway